MASSPIARPRGTTDKRRTTTTNSSASHHHDSAPSRPHALICTGAEPIHPVHSLPKLLAWPWPPETRSFSCNFGGFSHNTPDKIPPNMAQQPSRHTCTTCPTLCNPTSMVPTLSPSTRGRDTDKRTFSFPLYSSSVSRHRALSFCPRRTPSL